jgi:hypothetical protein
MVLSQSKKDIFLGTYVGIRIRNRNDVGQVSLATVPTSKRFRAASIPHPEEVTSLVETAR